MKPEKVRSWVAAAAGIAAAITLLPLSLPFLAGYGAAMAAEPAVAALGRRTPLPRWARTGLCVTALLVLAGGVLYFFFRVLCAEVSVLASELPDLLARLQVPSERLRLWLEDLAGRTGPTLAGPLKQWIEELFAGSSTILRSLAAWLTGLVSGAVGGLPKLLLGTVTALIAAYLISSGLPELKAWGRARLNERWLDRLRLWRRRVRAALGGWVKAEARLTGLIFAVLTLGLWLLGVEFPVLFGGLIALLDALPVLGSGTVLLPWALFAFLQGASARGFGLLALYAAAALTRAVLEPRLVGRQLGLHPLVTLAAVYVGFRLFGVPGMILLPMAVTVGKQFLGVNHASPNPADSPSAP